MNKVYKIITDRIIEDLNKGHIPWRKPWKGGKEGIPKNWQGKPYNGLNIWVLSTEAQIRGFEHNFWFGLGTTRMYHGRIKDGEMSKATKIVFNKPIVNKVVDSRGRTVEDKRFIFVYHNVWNYDQIDFPEVPPLISIEKEPEMTFNPILEAEKVSEAYKDTPQVEFVSQRAFYSPKRDIINMPKKESFNQREEYYSTLFHEFIHSTGHQSRLKRPSIDGSHFFGDPVYSEEELVAEFGASYLCGMSGIENQTITNSTGYIQSWLKVLKNDEKLLVKAAKKAQKAADYILGIKKEPYEQDKVRNLQDSKAS